MTTNLLELSQNPFIAVTGRVKLWLKQPYKIYPVSCTGVVVEDSYYEVDGDFDFLETIAGSRVFCHIGLKSNAGVAVDLSKIRPKGVDNGKGIVSQGIQNFLKMYSIVNEETRRGNSEYRNGAVNLYLDVQHPDIIDFLQFPKSDLPWVKRSVYVGIEIFEPKMQEVKELLIQKWSAGDIFLAKRRWDVHGKRLYTQVCTEIFFKSRSTCNLTHVNLGQIKNIEDIVPAFTDTMTFLCELWKSIDHSKGPYLDQTQDLQVGCGVIGLSNMLAHFGVKYSEFVGALQAALDLPITYKVTNTAQLIACELVQAFSEAGYIAKEKYGLERAFTIAPTTTSAFNHKDHRGYTTSPEISPPVAHPSTKQLVRVSDSGTEEYQYPPEVEIAGIDVPFDVYFDLAVCWQRLMDIDGLAHAISFNIWDTQVVDEDFLRKWMDSPLWTTYYRWVVTQAAQDKTTLQGLSVSKEDEDFWSTEFAEEETQTEFMSACSLDGVCTSCAT
jgi:Ribonucleotide reductase, barrel domain